MAELPPGQILGGKYTLQALLRRAPWASTHRAITSPNREVVIKVLDEALSGRTEVLEAIRKAETAGAALPAHLALRVVEHGVDAVAGVAFIVTPFAATPSLERLVELCALSPVEAVSFAKNLGRALDALHFAGYQHLALKPSNVFVGPAPECTVQLADFGANALRTTMAQGAQLAFAAPWLAPEQVEGDAKAGPEADVFAAALVTFFAMTGRSLWPSCRGAVVDVEAWRAEIAAAPPRASAAASDIGAVLDPAFDDAFAAALALPDARTKSVSVFAEALALALASVQPAPPAEASSFVATAISLPPDAIEPEPEALPTHTPTLSPPSGESLPPAPVPIVPPALVGAVQAPSQKIALARPHTVPYWNDEASQPPTEGGALTASAAVAAAEVAQDPFPEPVPSPLAAGAAPIVAGQAPIAAGAAPIVAGTPPAGAGAPAIAAIRPQPTIRLRRSGRQWGAVGLGVLLGVVVGVIAFGRTRGPSSSDTISAGAGSGAPVSGSPIAAGVGSVGLGATAPALSVAPIAAESAATTPADTVIPPPVTDPRPDDAELTIVCEPACDLVAIDSRPVADYLRPVRLRPGTHGVGASRAHYGGQWKQVVVRAGEKATVSFALTPSSGAKKPCGQFLKRCRD